MSPTIGILCPGDPTATSTWSGIPRQIVDGLRERSLDVCALNVDAPRTVMRWASLVGGGMMAPSINRAGVSLTPRQLRAIGSLSPAAASLRSVVARRRLDECAPLDGLIQVGTGYSVTTDAPIVTLEDMTVVQAREVGSAWRAMSPRAVAARIAGQASAYERARACCATTRWAAESIISDYGIPPTKVHVVGIGRNVEPGPEVVRRDWSPPRFLFVGREWERKNGPRVLAAFARLRTEVPDARIDVVGGHPPIHADGVVAHGLLALHDEAQRSRLAELFASATCFVMPSLHEPSAQAYVEASAWGIPSIVTANGGSTELVRDGGLVVDPLDDEGLLQTMRALCDPATAARLGGLAQKRAGLFTSRALAGRLLRALDLPAISTDALPAFV
ncbi:MAG: glycosyl transferase group 1 [Solirubrobacterales bacterium]|nr:glycosyl transferase group 1 [Solirubrobacterales bacterium]